ncbi:MAG: type II toxin-antitoxin system RelE/ParE family toxin [Gammaproteobacteria bacterium]|nr:type II toxin-antitoxin system RelE/ParE family toxin [Gammaproteobacteria bacterium]
MIKSFRHKGLRRFYETGSTAGIQAVHARKVRLELTALETAKTIDDMAVPGFHLHPHKGDRKGQWAISVSGNWRITFQFEDGNAYLLDYEDYHLCPCIIHLIRENSSGRST